MEPEPLEPRDSDRVAELERRVTQLEDALGLAARGEEHGALPRGDVRPGTYWALQGLQESMPEDGAVLFTGDVSLPGGHWIWQEQASTDALLEQDWSPVAGALGALNHPVRLRILQAVLAGHTSVSGLSGLEGLGTTGQLYHHLKALSSAGWLTSPTRAEYVVPGHRVVPLLVCVAAAASQH